MLALLEAQLSVFILTKRNSKEINVLGSDCLLSKGMDKTIGRSSEYVFLFFRIMKCGMISKSTATNKSMHRSDKADDTLEKVSKNLKERSLLGLKLNGIEL